MWIHRTVLTLVIVAATARMAAITVGGVYGPSDPSQQRDAVKRVIDSRELDVSPAELGVESIRFEQFDDRAAVVLLPGDDQQPGVAGVDDNGNAVVDDRSELGATGSDDVCVVRPSEQTSADPSAIELVLQRGAFVPVQGGAQVSRSQSVRAIVSGRTGSDRWSFLVSMP